MINNLGIVSSVEQSDSVKHMLVSILFQILSPFRYLQNIEQSYLCYTSRALLVIHFKYSTVWDALAEVRTPNDHCREHEFDAWLGN